MIASGCKWLLERAPPWTVVCILPLHLGWIPYNVLCIAPLSIIYPLNCSLATRLFLDMTDVARVKSGLEEYEREDDGRPNFILSYREIKLLGITGVCVPSATLRSPR